MNPIQTLTGSPVDCRNPKRKRDKRHPDRLVSCTWSCPRNSGAWQVDRVKWRIPPKVGRFSSRRTPLNINNIKNVATQSCRSDPWTTLWQHDQGALHRSSLHWMSMILHICIFTGTRFAFFLLLSLCHWLTTANRWINLTIIDSHEINQQVLGYNSRISRPIRTHFCTDVRWRHDVIIGIESQKWIFFDRMRLHDHVISSWTYQFKCKSDNRQIQIRVDEIRYCMVVVLLARLNFAEVWPMPASFIDPIDHCSWL